MFQKYKKLCEHHKIKFYYTYKDTEFKRKKFYMKT